MLTKEECKKSLDILKEQLDYLRFNMQSNYPYTISMIKNVINCFSNLIEEHFELIEEHKKLDASDTSKEECTIEQYGEIKELRNELKNFKNPQPYKFEELDEEMYVYDYETEEVLLIEYTTEVVRTGEKLLYCWQFKNEQGIIRIKFEENRFYPVTKALEYQ